MRSPSEGPPRLGNVLIERGYCTLENLEVALAAQREQRGFQTKLLGEILVEMGFCTEDQVIESLAAEYRVPYAKLEARLFDPKVIDILPRDYIEQNLVLPLFVVRKVLTIAVAEPSNLFLIDELRSLTQLEV